MTLLAPVVVAVAVVGAALWVLVDARRWARQGTPVVLRVGSVTIASPEEWAIACLLVFVVFLPVYAAARRPPR